MPSITPSYLYTFVALIAVSGLLVFSFKAYADALLVSSEAKQLKNLMNQVVAKSIELLTLTLETNATTEAFLHMPSAIGNKQYWLQLRNDSASTWLEGGFGNSIMERAEPRVYLPNAASATGYYKGGYGTASLKCYVSATGPKIQLAKSSEGG